MKAIYNVLYEDSAQYPQQVSMTPKHNEQWPYTACRLAVFVDPLDGSRVAVFDLINGMVRDAFRTFALATDRRLWDARTENNAALIRRAIAEFDAFQLDFSAAPQQEAQND